MSFQANKDIDMNAVRDVLRTHKGRALHVMEVCARLGLGSSARDDVRAALEALSEEGIAQELPGLRFRSMKGREPAKGREAPRGQPARASEPQVPRRVAPPAKVGILRIHARGHGFVMCEDGHEDIFVPPQELLGALHGDRVAASARRGERGFEGSIIAVLHRHLKYAAGLLQHGERGLVVLPNDARLPRMVHIVGKVPGDAVPGIEVVSEIVKFFDDGSFPEARIVRVLGAEGSAEVEVAKIKLREGIREEFPEDVMAEAQAFGDRLSVKDRKGREDLRDLDLVTIDPLTARDHDDAIFIERLPKGQGYHVVIAIADVSHYVVEGSAIDREAIERCTSIYLPDRAIPMLPPELSSNLASLVANKDRLTLAIDMELAANGNVRSFRYVEGLMRCKAGLTYEGVAHALGLSEKGRVEKAALKLKPMLEVLHECAMVLRQKRMKRGSLDFDLPEPSVELETETGEPKNVSRSRKDPGIRKAYQLVEEMMLLANETVAADLGQRKIPAIYRVHGVPDESRLEQFAGLAQALGYALDPEDVSDPRALSHFLQKLEESPHKSSLSYLLLRAMQQATYDVVDIGHFGLAAPHYLHFTSPIRRYPDLAVHRVVRKLARGEPIDLNGLERKLSEQARSASKLERRAMGVEREVIDVYRCILVKPRIGDEFEATVTGVAPHGMYCAFDEPFVEALCHVSLLGNDFYELDKHGLRLVGRRSGASYGLGDRLTVRLESVNVAERSILAAPVVYVHPDELDERRAFAPNQDGFNKVKRRAQADRSRWGSHHPAAAEAPTERPRRANKEKTDDLRGNSERPQREPKKAQSKARFEPAAVDAREAAQKRERRRERRNKDERKQKKRRR